MRMKRKCNLELSLEPPRKFHRTHMVDEDGGDTQQLTIFYNGKIAVCDATELQAREIIWFASHEVESNESTQFDLPSPWVASPLVSPTTGLKRSLMRFLHTRKSRVQATSPYPFTRN